MSRQELLESKNSVDENKLLAQIGRVIADILYILSTTKIAVGTLRAEDLLTTGQTVPHGLEEIFQWIIYKYNALGLSLPCEEAEEHTLALDCIEKNAFPPPYNPILIDALKPFLPMDPTGIICQYADPNLETVYDNLLKLYHFISLLPLCEKGWAETEEFLENKLEPRNFRSTLNERIVSCYARKHDSNPTRIVELILTRNDYPPYLRIVQPLMKSLVRYNIKFDGSLLWKVITNKRLSKDFIQFYLDYHYSVNKPASPTTTFSLPEPLQDSVHAAAKDEKHCPQVFQMSLLVAASYFNRLEAVKLLLEDPKILASINTPDDNGHLALCEAVRQGHTRVVELLLKKGADPTLACHVVDESFEDTHLLENPINLAKRAYSLFEDNRHSQGGVNPDFEPRYEDLYKLNQLIESAVNEWKPPIVAKKDSVEDCLITDAKKNPAAESKVSSVAPSIAAAVSSSGFGLLRPPALVKEKSIRITLRNFFACNR